MNETAIELYPDRKHENYFDAPADYSPLLDNLGSIILQVDDKDYQGDSRVLYRDGSKIGYLQFGWGSCSGCDALQGCDSYGDIDDLMNSLSNTIKWFDSPAEALSFFLTHDWEGDYSNSHEKQKEFIDAAIMRLKGEQ